MTTNSTDIAHGTLRCGVGDTPAGTIVIAISDTGIASISALRSISVDETRLYGRIVTTSATPFTAQEEGAADVLAVAIPRDRVLKADGGISDYGWACAASTSSREGRQRHES